MSNNVLVTGGAGYIGSHTVLQLLESGNQVVVLDNLYSGHRWAIPDSVEFVQGDIKDRSLVEQIIQRSKIDAVIHFAGHIVVPESIENPAKYYRNNVVGSINLIEACVSGGVEKLVFSSSAAVYGEPAVCPVNETVDTEPINPYGSTKLITEWNLRDFAAASDSFNFVALRYFNVAGAHTGGKLGQATPNATHLIKVACEAACGYRPGLSIYGDDYPTVDGTCVRDYIHVDDLAAAHLDALAYLNQGNPSEIMNCGYGQGFSVRQVIDCIRSISGIDFEVVVDSRRPGDPPQLVADNKKIKRILGWKPKYNDLEIICRSAYLWEKKLRNNQIE